jgi:hypothetical protein
VRFLLSDFGIAVLRFTAEETPRRSVHGRFNSSLLFREQVTNGGKKRLGNEHRFEAQGMSYFKATVN